MPQAIHISPIDNVVVALHPIAKGTLVEVDGLAVTALEDIPQGHKMAVKPIKNGENVIKYGFPIGHATADAAPGSWMHTHNVHTNLSGEVEYSYNPAPDLAPLPKVEPETFMGFRRKDGRAAIRNEIWIIPTVGCVNDIAKKIVADNQDLVTGSIEGLYTFTHPFGCSQTGHDHAQTRKLLAALVRHPNAAAVLVLHLGCENLQHDQFVEELGEYASLTAVNSCLPKTPPRAAPNANGVPVLKSTTLSRDAAALPTEYKLIESTVQPDKKLIVDTLAIWNRSKTGLMITPPPIPQIAPAVDARKLTRNATIDIL